MVWIMGESTCSICDKVLKWPQDIIGFPAFMADEKHHLSRFNDSPMHRECLLKWKHKDEFLKLWFDAMWNHLNDSKARSLIGSYNINSKIQIAKYKPDKSFFYVIKTKMFTPVFFMFILYTGEEFIFNPFELNELIELLVEFDDDIVNQRSITKVSASGNYQLVWDKSKQSVKFGTKHHSPDGKDYVYTGPDMDYYTWNNLRRTMLDKIGPVDTSHLEQDKTNT